MRSLAPFWPRSTASVLILLLAACASDDRPRHGTPPKPPQPIAGEANYFDGALVASIRVGMEFQRPEGDGAGRGRREGGERRGGGGGMSIGGGAGPMRFGGGGGGRGERGGGPPGEFAGGRDGGPRVRPANGLPLMIHVKLHNTGTTALEVAVRDFVSPLGNFVVQPATLAVAAGESVEFSPMTSFVQGDLPDEMPATLTLRVTGKTEKQVIVLRPVARNAAPPSAPDPESRPIQK
ncbi:MAG TPA: hypothetical protein VK477_02525 [Acidobacteriota bacterium]|nr:hypothetical protein [Acidobacteriota bacterium]